MKKLLTLLFLLALAGSAEAYKFASGTYTGTGSGFTVDISDTSDFEDFQPDVCFVKGDAVVDGVIRISGMDATESMPLDGSPIVTTGITALAANGFTIGTGTTVNTAAQAYYYVCFATDASNDFAFGTFTGNGGNDTQVNITPSFASEIVFTIGEAEVGRWRGANSHVGDITSNFSAIAESTNRIDQINATGFRVDSQANTNLLPYFYFAFKAGTSTVKTGTYLANTGTCADDCAVTGVGFRPQFVWIKANAANNPVGKFTPQTGDDTCALNSGGDCTVNLIQTFETDGFTYGGSGTVNTNGIDYRWFAIREAAAATGIVIRRRGF